eukprot:6182956-Pleurochrysis_carterae.AAC.1
MAFSDLWSCFACFLCLTSDAADNSFLLRLNSAEENFSFDCFDFEGGKAQTRFSEKTLRTHIDLQPKV